MLKIHFTKWTNLHSKTIIAGVKHNNARNFNRKIQQELTYRFGRAGIHIHSNCYVRARIFLAGISRFLFDSKYAEIIRKSHNHKQHS
jgi:hypothetical protein